MIIANKKIDFFLIKFPIIFPVIYFLFLKSFPNFENFIIFFTILVLAEPHFAATWPFFIHKSNKEYIKSKRNELVFTPILIAILSIIGFFYFNKLFLLIFYAANIYHVTRQSFGICKLYSKNSDEIKFQEYLIYFFNGLFFLIGFFRFYLPVIGDDFIQTLNVIVLTLITCSIVYNVMKYKISDRILTFFTGCIIFYPICFVDNAVHAILMGVTMHYTQYIVLTYKITKKREVESNHIEKSSIFLNYKYIVTLIIYAVVMFAFSMSKISDHEFIKNLILIPILGQLLHFYIDSQLWKFSEEHNRNNVLKYIKDKW